MKCVLLAYYPLGEVPKVIIKLAALLKENKINVKTEELILEEDLSMKKQFKLEKKLVLKNKIPSLKSFDLIVIGTPIVSFSSVPAINIFIRSLPKVAEKKFALFATGIGLPGTAIKKMTSLLSMQKGKVVATQVFSSIFEFDEKKLREVNKLLEQIKAQL
ncbi:MAG: hypothetical protein HOE11_00385 [Candidatus Diapherotrites archaeon]|jgi:hypothetical protein|nr:hypothetical protein [Candidatus Diapherotrites archaeon]